MSDATAPRKSSPWPLLAIVLLVVLLSSFLVLQLGRNARPPAVVKAPPPVEPPPTPPDPPPPPPVVADPPSSAKATEGKPKSTPVEPPKPPPEDPRVQESAQFLKQAETALREARWDDARAALQKARDAGADADKVKDIDKAIADGQAREARQKQDQAFALAREQAEKDLGRDHWDAAAKVMVDHLKAFPAAAQDEEFRRIERKVREYAEAADQQFRKVMGEARKHLEEKRYPSAVVSSDLAAKYYPERRPEVKKFQESVNARMMQENMVLVDPKGAPFHVGSDDPAHPDEHPLRRVELKPFHVDKYEVTNADYQAFVLATDHPAPPHWRGGKPPTGRERHPVVYVTYDDAAKYAAWAGKRLPTADEWEAAARGTGSPRLFPWGDDFTEKGKDNEFRCNCKEYAEANKGRNPGTLPVDAFDKANSASPYGVYGMAGNAWEWTSTVVKQPNGAGFRVLKGGSWMTFSRALRSSNVYPENPALAHPDVGFRCVKDAP